MNKTPDFVIIGAMKSATSSLHEQLACQPGIFMSQLKEPNFFSDEDQYEKGIDWYLSHFINASSTELCGESSTHYTKLPTYPKTVTRIKKHLPSAKFIYVMRHPIDRLISQYIHEWTQRIISVDINKALMAHPELIEYSLYSKQLSPYIETFGVDQVLPMFFERICQDSQQELNRTCEFIGYTGTPTWQLNLGAQNVSRERLRKDPIRDFFVEAPLLRDIRKTVVPQRWRNWIKSWWQMSKKPEINPENLSYLEYLFNQDLKILGEWLGLENLSCGNYKDRILLGTPQWKHVPFHASTDHIG